MVIIVAAALSTASELLKPYQNKNIENEKFQGILSAAEVDVPRSQANEAFEEYIVEELAINSEGDVVCRYVDGKLIEGDVRPFNIVLKDKRISNMVRRNVTLNGLFISWTLVASLNM